MMTWGRLRMFIANVYGAPTYADLSDANRGVCEVVMQQAAQKVWEALDQSTKIKDGVVNVASRQTFASGEISGTAGENKVTLVGSSINPAFLKRQRIYWGDETHEIAYAETSGSDVVCYFHHDTVQTAPSDSAFIDTVFYLLPADFAGFLEIPADWQPQTGTVDENDFDSRVDYQLQLRGVYSDYVPETGTVDITVSGKEVILTGSGTSWTSDLVGQSIIVSGNRYVVRSLSGQVARAWGYEADYKGGSPAGTGLSYTLDLQGRRGVVVFASNRRSIHFRYMAAPPQPGLDDEPIPFEADQALSLWAKYYWAVMSNTSPMTAQETQLVLLSAKEALRRVAGDTNPLVGTVDSYGRSNRTRPRPGHADPRTLHYRTDRYGQREEGQDWPLSRR